MHARIPIVSSRDQGQAREAMGGFNPPVPQQDSNWEIRVAMLLSLALQALLLIAGPMRKRSSSPVARVAIWSSYVLADWVADLALGLLLNNMGNIGGGRLGGSSSPSTASVGGHSSTDSSSSSPVIFAFWTPFLLLHLGGQDTITGYCIEDNELWRRHLIGLLFEVFSAAVIFFCSLQSNHMILATILMFVVGIIKYGERTYSLYSGSVDGVLANILSDSHPGPNYAKLMTEFDAKEKAGLAVEIIIADGEAKKAQDALEQDDYWDKKLKIQSSSNKSLEARAYDLFLIFRCICYDVILSTKLPNMTRQVAFLYSKKTAKKAFEVMELELNFLYDMVHTKAPIAHTKAGLVLRFVGSGCLASAFAIFFLLDKGSIHRVDVGITYALLLGGLALDAAALVMLLSSNRMVVLLEESRRFAWLERAARRLRKPSRRWSETTSQLNLVSYCLGKPDKTDGFASPRVIQALANVADALRVREIFDDLFFVQRERFGCRSEGEEHYKFIFDGIKDAAREFKRAAYQKMKRTNSYRGEGVLHKALGKSEVMWHSVTSRDFEESLALGKSEVMWHSVTSRDFEESLLMWHIATDLCLLPTNRHTVPHKGTYDMMSISKTLSEYMLYLLVMRPKILWASAGMGKISYQDTCAEARRFFESAAVWDPDHADARRMLLSVNTSKEPREVKGDRSKSVLFDACILAKELREHDEDTMWKTVAGVWLDMLAYAAHKCNWSTHVQQLSRGGELITLFWFLMTHMGLNDNVEKYQIQLRDANAKLIIHDQ